MWEKINEPPNVTKVQSHVMLVLYNVRMKLSNVRKKIGNHQMWQSTVTFDIGTAQYEDETVKCEKRNKGTTKCDKRVVTYNVWIAQFENGIVKCEKKKLGNHQMWQNFSHMWC